MAETSLTTPERLSALLSWLGATLGADDVRLVEVTAPDGTVSNGAGHAAILPTGLLPLRGLG